jgi:Mn-containing catalase
MVEQYYNDSTGTGDHGAIDADGPWKTADGIMVVKSPALKGFKY